MKRSNKLKSVAAARKRERKNHRQVARDKRNKTARENARARATMSFEAGSFYALAGEKRPVDSEQSRRGTVSAPKEGPSRHFGLSEAFRQSINWHLNSEMNDLHFDVGSLVVQMKRYTGDGLNAVRDNYFVAYNHEQSTEAENAANAKAVADFWANRIDETWRPKIDFVKSGPLVWKSLGLDMSPEACRFFLTMKDCDETTAEAFYAALLTAVNTSPVPADWEGIILALATFVHAHPAFSSMVEDGEFHQPFGENTRWKLLKKPAAA